MMKLQLNGAWRMRRTGQPEWLAATVPGSVFNDLLTAGRIADPFYRDNEDQAKEIAAYDYEYEREFEVDRAVLDSDKVFLVCEGLDTFTEITVNDRYLAATDNMFRRYELDVKSLLKLWTNVIRVTVRSPLRYIEEKDREQPLYHATGSMAGYPYLRKAHYMFGWDWGPQIPDAGIWRPLSLCAYRDARIEDVYITQDHGDDGVFLDIRVRLRKWSAAPCRIGVHLIAPTGERTSVAMDAADDENHLRLAVADPRKWWPNGYGEQPLYGVEVVLWQEGAVLDERHCRIGLRTLRLKRAADRWGETFEFEVNGVSIFAMGANYIPEDNLLARCTLQRTEQLIRDCVAANFNCIRIWGGGVYPADEFFDCCDQYGLIVWHDLMFACAMYQVTPEFAESIRREVTDNIRRIRHHACLGMWCGNNELEWFWTGKFKDKPAKQKHDYVKQFEELLPEVAAAEDPNTSYWPSSPSSGGWFDDPNDENRGDVHYWDVWHGLKPFTAYRDFYFRFTSEFGFQSFPCLKTVESFTLPQDRNIFSYVMEKHQKNPAANGKILYHIADNFKYPKDLDSLLYASQVLQGEAMKYGVEHWRRNRGRCMGTIYWQLNDCWPVASWASIDYYGRWKALHYFAKRFYAPILASACETGSKADLYVNNDSLAAIRGRLDWKLLHNGSGAVLAEGGIDVAVAPLRAECCLQLDFEQALPDQATRMNVYLAYSLTVDGTPVGAGTVLFVKPKHFELQDPRIQWEVEATDGQYVCRLRAESLAKYVELDSAAFDCRFSDNYFDLWPGETRRIVIDRASLPAGTGLAELREGLKVRSLFEIA
ncbi:beta-mannosidase [Hydrogenispora ethanolica]|uniref:Beta-mannosidase B n=1 Tax=Hydrogenispora ethanolica TaxID=1082276 RepID=A0A4R1RVV9_HYDET|nr:glycoside hydrolase family 2 protein [Hydrogenispora ethanolica]TCL70082.1 beta-mannosidase [Hydrogenispora ethanolica]